jgi:integrase
MSTNNPAASLVVRESRGGPFYEAFWRLNGKLVKRRVGPAWLERDAGAGEWRPRRGRVAEGFYDERRAHVAAAQLVAAHVKDWDDRERMERERRIRGVTFREVAHGYLRWLADVKGAKPSTLADYAYILAEPGVAYKRREGESAGHIMAALGDLPAAAVSVRDVEAMLASLTATKTSARSVNKHRAIVSAVYGYGMKDAAYGLPANPAAAADKRRERRPGVLAFYTPEEVEALARALAEGLHRDPTRPAVGEQERAEDRQDAEIVRVAAYAGLRQGELLALRWRDVDFTRHALTVARAMSAGIESSTKSGRVRRVPLPEQAAAALNRLSRRANYTGRDELVFCNAFGRALNASALRRRFKRARDAAKLRRLRFHDLRHTYGSLLAAAGVDLVTIQSAMGHAALTTTSRYLHARPANEQAEVFTRAFATQVEPPAGEPSHTPT